MDQLAAMGNEQTKKVLMRHGAQELFFGVKVQDMKSLQKKIKTSGCGNRESACENG